MDEVTPVMLGEDVSITIALFELRELAADGEANVNIASLPALSLTVPPFNARAVVD